MKVNVVLDKDVKETEITIKTNEIDDNLRDLISVLENIKISKIIGEKDNKKYLLDIDKIVRFYSFDKKVYASYNGSEYLIKQRLYELEEKLNKSKFIRISNSEIIAIEYIKRLEISFGGSIKLETTVGIITYVSRSYLKKFKEIINY